MFEMSKILWTTDTHFDGLGLNKTRMFGDYVRSDHPNIRSIIISGDIANAETLKESLESFQQGFGGNVYFVLGNHDYYGSCISDVRRMVSKIRNSNLFYLPLTGPVKLNHDTVMIGIDGWYDALLGRVDTSRFSLNDFTQVKDIKKHNIYPGILTKVKEIAEDETKAAKHFLDSVVNDYSQILFVTHIPPFRESSWHLGKIPDEHDNALPWFTSVTMGMMLEKFAASHPNTKILTLCGHTHSPGVYKHSENLSVFTGKSDYGMPQEAGIIDLKDLYKSTIFGV